MSLHQFWKIGQVLSHYCLRNSHLIGSGNALGELTKKACGNLVIGGISLIIMSREGVLDMPAIMHDIYKSVDFCHYIISAHDRKSGKTIAPYYFG